MLIERFSEDVTWLRNKVTVQPNGLRRVTAQEMGKLRGAFTKKSSTQAQSAGTVIPITRYTFTTSQNAELIHGDILKRSDGSMVRIVSGKSSPPRIEGSILRINQYITEETDYDGRSGNI